MFKKILVTGSLAFDHIMDFTETFEENIIPEKIKTLSVSFLAKNFSKNYGGVAGNIAYNLALLGQKPSILSSCGKMDFETYAKHLENAGVETNFINYVESEFSANMFMITDKNNCQIAGFYPGAMSMDEKLLIIKSDGFDFLIVSPTVPDAMNSFVCQTKKLRIPYLYDPAQQIPRLSADQIKNGLKGAEIIIGNDYEIALIEKKTGLNKKTILENAKIVITTFGEKGSMIETKKEKIIIGVSKPKKIVDPTGAGDAYIAGFMAGYIKEHPLHICGQMGAIAAVYAIEHYGTQKHKFKIEDFENRYKETFKESFNL